MFSRFVALAAMLGLTAHSLHAYALTGSHWYSSPITMQLQLGANATPLSDGSASWGASAEDALSTWNQQIAGAKFSVVRDSTAPIAEGNGTNNVFFSANVYGQTWGTGVLAVTLTYTSGGSQSAECDVLFNNNLSWDSYRGAQRYTTSGAVYDFHRVAMHEFGHVLGLDHPDQAGQTVVALMNSHISDLDTLAADDIAGAQSIYGAAATATATPPSITTQPKSQTVTAGSNVSFTVSASSATTMTYQWLKNGTPISGATASSLTLFGTTTSSAGNYSVTVSNSAGSTSSATATLTVNAAVTAPAITTQPASQTVTAGNSVTFTVGATGSAPLAYAWSKNGVAISGASGASYSITSAQSGDAGNYSVRVSNSAGAVTSATATLTVNAPATAPTITAQPASQSVQAGSSATFTVAATGTGPLSYVWRKNGVAISSGAAASYAISSAQTGDAGNYSVVVSNSVGSVTSTIATLAVSTPATAPTIVAAPIGQTVSVGTQVTLSVTATGAPAPTYQWQKNGNNLAGATNSTLVIGSAAPTDSGTYAVVVTNSAGVASTVPVLLTVNYSQLVNISTRGYVSPGSALTAGFALRGSSAKPMIVRGIGPTLTTFGVSDALSNPQLALVAQTNSQTLAVNSGWSDTPQLTTAFESVGAFPLPSGSADSASELQLMPGSYTTRVTSDAGAGVALAEVYDGDPNTVATRLVNVSTLGYAGVGEDALVAGFTVQGNAPKRVLIRAVGPSLAPYNVTGLLADPQFQVCPLGATSAIASNDNWSDSAAIEAAFTTSGAFPLSSGSRDAALVLSLQPGAYTVTVTGVGNTTGNVLVEIYDLDP